MPVGFDNTILSVLLNPNANVPNDPATGKPPDLPKERIQGLVAKLQKERQKIIIPAPAAAELLTVIGPTASDYFDVINRARVFEVRAFDEVSAIELAFLNRDVFGKQDGKNKLAPWQKIKVDRQILAVCKVAKCDTLYTDDKALIQKASLCGMKAVRICDLPIPEDARQGKLALEPHDPLPGDDEAAR